MAVTANARSVFLRHELNVRSDRFIHEFVTASDFLYVPTIQACVQCGHRHSRFDCAPCSLNAAQLSRNYTCDTTSIASRALLVFRNVLGKWCGSCTFFFSVVTPGPRGKTCIRRRAARAYCTASTTMGLNDRPAIHRIYIEKPSMHPHSNLDEPVSDARSARLHHLRNKDDFHAQFVRKSFARDVHGQELKFPQDIFHVLAENVLCLSAASIAASQGRTRELRGYHMSNAKPGTALEERSSSSLFS